MEFWLEVPLYVQWQIYRFMAISIWPVYPDEKSSNPVKSAKCDSTRSQLCRPSRPIDRAGHIHGWSGWSGVGNSWKFTCNDYDSAWLLQLWKLGDRSRRRYDKSLEQRFLATFDIIHLTQFTGSWAQVFASRHHVLTRFNRFNLPLVAQKWGNNIRK